MEYRVEVLGPARRQLERLPSKAYDAVAAFLDGPLRANPQRVGKPLRNEFAGGWSARVGPYRVLYRIADDVQVVAVIRIAHRAEACR